ncbi:gp53-like domain-containing protein [Rhizobium sp. 11515TR]|uniref:gp53-like domain-containing protein n=1 Tax=Rhizobium sp. 11515TR TaxID=2028343 RepID=UPI000BA8CAF7|nr:hypothetical protein [Rhizobium sp. 11515TR]ASW06316.1 hypothetical protein CKA34_10760 [Rhizobium sp. 11515TR]
MRLSDLPSGTFPIAFGSSAGGGYIRQVPVNSQIGITNGAASLTDGFPPLTFLPVGSGGVPPFGQDFNGILNQITQWTRWQNAGGLATYISALSTAIGGYPQGALLASSVTAGLVWLNTVDNNTTNPDSGGVGWVPIATASAIQSNQYCYAVAGGTANALTAALNPVPSSIGNGFIFDLLIASTNTGPTTLNLNSEGVRNVTLMNGTALRPGDLAAGQIATFVRSGTTYLLQTPNTIPSTTLAATGSARLSEGPILQWGLITASPTGTGTQTFPVAFPNACVNVQVTDLTTGSLATIDLWGTDNWSTTSFRWWTVTQAGAANNGGAAWMAIGY